ncbi:MAG: ComEC/Rec2 family competence protein, partial [Clostridiales bacterium]|nr:ComEC/Rec2 family competence protein [Clostridiales bacterium]
MYEYFLQKDLIISKVKKELAVRPLIFPAVISVLMVFMRSSVMALLLAVLFAALIFISWDKRHKLMFSLSAILALYIFLVFSMCEKDVSDCYVKDLDCFVLKTELKMDGSSRICLYNSDFGRLMMYGTSEDIYPGEIIHVSGAVATPGPPSNPGEFDYRSYLRSKGINATIYQEKTEVVSRGSKMTSVLSYLIRGSFDIRSKVASLFGDMEAEACGIFMGDTTLLADETGRSFRLTGCAHLMAVSGTHFSGFLMAFPFVLGTMGVRKGKATFIHGVLCILMGIFTGWSESVTRAAFMSITAFSSRDHYSAMSMAAVAICVTDPYSLMSSGFLMSFSAGLSIRLIGGRLDRALEDRHVPGIIRGLLVPVLSAQAGMLPFMIRQNYRIGLLNLVVCSVASLIAQLACVFFIPSVILTLLTGPLFMEPVLIPLKLLFKLLDSYAPLALLSPRADVALLIPAFALIPLLMADGRLKILYKKIIPLLLCVSAGIVLSSFLFEPEASVVFIDVGQGDSCLIICGNTSVLIDGGTFENGGRVASVLDYYGIGTVDIAVMTHLDEDHMGGILYLYEKGRVREVLTSCPGDSPLPSTGIYQGDVITFGEDMSLRCIWPRKESFHDGENEDSVVLMLESSGCRILFTGDAGMESEVSMAEEGTLSDADILKVAHHGSRYSTGDLFLSEVLPEYSIISVGRNNPYGHPAEETLSRLSDHFSDVIRTSDKGAVTVNIYGSYYKISTF